MVLQGQGRGSLKVKWSIENCVGGWVSPSIHSDGLKVNYIHKSLACSTVAHWGREEGSTPHIELNDNSYKNVKKIG